MCKAHLKKKKAKLHTFRHIHVHTMKVGIHSSLTSELTSVNVAVNLCKRFCKSVNPTNNFSSFSNSIILVDHKINFLLLCIFFFILNLDYIEPPDSSKP